MGRDCIGLALLDRQQQVRVLHQVPQVAILRLRFQRSVIQLRLLQIVQQRPGVRGRHEHIDKRKSLLQPRRFLHAHEAAHQRQRHIWTPLLGCLERPQPAIDSVFCLLFDHAGIENHQIRLFRRIARLIAQMFQLRRHASRVRLIHLAPHGPDMIRASGF